MSLWYYLLSRETNLWQQSGIHYRFGFSNLTMPLGGLGVFEHPHAKDRMVKQHAKTSTKDLSRTLLSKPFLYWTYNKSTLS